MKTVEVIIDAEGNVKVETRGILGAGCEALSRAIEESLGVATSNVKKPEFFFSSNMEAKNNATS